MSKIAKGGIATLPAPTMGIDWSVAPEEVQYPYSPNSLDWIANGYSTRIRDPHVQKANTSGFKDLASHVATGEILSNITSGGSPGIYKYVSSSETATRIHTASLPFFSYTNYQGRVFLTTAAGAASYDGTTFNSTAFTGATVATAGGCCVYRDRLIIVSGTTLYYAPSSGAVSGALSSFNLSSYYTTGIFVDCVPITIQDSSNLADYLVLVSSSGDILAFTGDFPGSANWQLAVKTRVSVYYLGTLSAFIIGFVPYAGDAFLYVGYPVKLISVKELIQSGPIEAEKNSPLAKQINLIRDPAASSPLITIGLSEATNSLILIFGGTTSKFTSGQFGITTTSSVYCFNIDLSSGAVSPITFPSESYLLNTVPYKTKILSHSDGYVYVMVEGTGTLWKCLDSTATDTEENYDTYLEFPNSDLGAENSIKNLAMAYPTMSRYGGYVEAKIALRCDFDTDSVTTHTSASGSASASTLVTKRLIVPIAGSGSQVSIALINKRRPRLACERIAIQFEDGGPY